MPSSELYPGCSSGCRPNKLSTAELPVHSQASTSYSIDRRTGVCACVCRVGVQVCVKKQVRGKREAVREVRDKQGSKVWVYQRDRKSRLFTTDVNTTVVHRSTEQTSLNKLWHTSLEWERWCDEMKLHLSALKETHGDPLPLCCQLVMLQDTRNITYQPRIGVNYT